MLVSQKLLPDGTLASRTETRSPIEKISVVVGDESYDIYPDQGVAVDTQFMRNSAQSQAATLSAALGVRAAHSAILKGTVRRGGKLCFEIETTYSPQVTALVGKTLSDKARKLLPKGNRFYIDKDTYVLVEMEVISQTGALIAKMEYKDITPHPDLPDELFLPPDGLEVRKPQSLKEYADLVAELRKPLLTALPAAPDLQGPREITPPLPPPARLGPLEVEPTTGRATVAVPPGMSREDFARLVAEKRAELRVARKGEPQVIGMSIGRKIGISVSLITIIALLTILSLQRLAKISTRTARGCRNIVEEKMLFTVSL
jgi:hypothetical protein